MSIDFRINGRSVRPDKIADALEEAIVKKAGDYLKREIADVTDPATGEYPKVTASGKRLSDFKIEVQGSEDTIQKVREKFTAKEEISAS